MIVFISSSARPRYADDIIRMLALPKGGQMQFRYSDDWLADEVRSRVPGGQLADEYGLAISPRLRQIREGLDALGLKSDAILHHATPRIFYGCELVPGARPSLVGLGGAPAAAASSADVAAAWRQRWLLARVARPETLEALRRLGPTSIRASLHADIHGQFSLPIDTD